MEETKPEPINPGIRLASMAIDHVIMTIIAVLFCMPVMVVSFANAFKVTHEQVGPDMFGGSFMYISIIGFALYFCKDSIKGRSVAKRILRLQVVNNSTGEAASPLRCFIRNIFCVLWPVEVIVALVNPSRRIGDRIAGTRLVKFDRTKEQPKANILLIITSLALSYGFMFLLVLPFKAMEAKMGLHKIPYIEASYNDVESKATEKLYADSLGQYLEASVKVYDHIQDKPLKYVSVIFQLKKDYVNDDNDFEQLKSRTVPLLFLVFPEKTFIGKIKYVYETDNSMVMRTITVDRTKGK